MDSELLLLRDKLKRIDDKIIQLFIKRMNIARQIGNIKEKNGLPIYDAHQEKQKIDYCSHIKDQQNVSLIKALVLFLMNSSCLVQQQELFKHLNRTISEQQINTTDRKYYIHAQLPNNTVSMYRFFDRLLMLELSINEIKKDHDITSEISLDCIVETSDNSLTSFDLDFFVKDVCLCTSIHEIKR